VEVDDGSPDGPIDILQAHAARDRRLQIVRQANAGMGCQERRAQHARGQHSPWAATAN
jgi:CDP-glycerol glycerophosphotransferase